MGKIQIFILAANSINITRLKSFLKSKKSISISGHGISLDSSSFLTTQTSGIMLIDDAFFDNTQFRYFINEIIKTRNGTRFIIYTGSDDIDYFNWLINRGIQGIVHKRSPRQKLVEAINLVYANGVFLDNRIDFIITKERIFQKIEDNSYADFLTKREKDVLELILLRFENKAIAEKLFISVKTVEFHKEKIKQRLGIDSIKALYNKELSKS